MRYIKIVVFTVILAVLLTAITAHATHAVGEKIAESVNVFTDSAHYPIDCSAGETVYDTGGGWFACRSADGSIVSGTTNYVRCAAVDTLAQAQAAGMTRKVDGYDVSVHICYQLIGRDKLPTKTVGGVKDGDTSSSEYWNGVFALGLTDPTTKPVTTQYTPTCGEGYTLKKSTGYEVGRGTYEYYECKNDKGRLSPIVCPEGSQASGETGVCTGAAQEASPPPPVEENTTNEQKTCGNTMEHMGWLFCGIIDLSVGFADAMWGLFEGLLAVEPLGVGNGASSLIGTWSNLRGIANVLFTIVFVVIVFSQISNIGISNYGIKKMLPRFVIAAVGVNISFFLMQVIIDSSNILGKTTHDFIMSASSIDMSSFNWGDILVEILAASTAVGAGAGVGIAGAVAAIGVVGTAPLLIFLLVLIIPAVIGIVAGVLALGFRMAIIQVLAIISPLALVAWILPNTQKLFDKWSAAFFSLVFMYPLASIYYGGVKLMALTLLGNPDNSVITKMIALGLLFISVFLVAGMVLKSNNIMNKATGTVSGFLGKITNPATKFGMGLAGGMAGVGMARMRSTDFSKGRWRNPRVAVGRVMRRFDRARRDREINKANYEAAADYEYKKGLVADPTRLSSVTQGVMGADERIRQLAHATTSTEIKNAELSIEGRSIEDLKRALKDAIANNDDIRARAAQNQLLARGGKGVDTFSTAVAEAEAAGANNNGAIQALRANIQAAHGGVIQSDPALGAWSSSSANMKDAQGSAYANTVSASSFGNMSNNAQQAVIRNGGVDAATARILLNPSSPESGKVSPEARKILSEMYRPK